MELRSGDLVEVEGLKTAELNGQSGTLWRLDEESGRWEVKLQNGDMKSIRPENLCFQAVSPVEDDGTLALVGMATEHPVMQRILTRLQEQNMKEMLEATQLVSHVLSPKGGGKAEGADVPVWLKLARQAQQKVRGSLEDLQKNLEEVDGIDPTTLASGVAEELRMARKDLVRFVQGAQERLEGVLGRLQPLLRQLAGHTAPEKKHGWAAENKDEAPLHEKYKEAFRDPAAGAARDGEKHGTAGEAKAEPLLKPMVVKYQGKGDNPPPSDNLYVKGLPGWVTEEELREIFQDGEVQSMKIKAAEWGAIAFIRLLNKSAATRAIHKLNNTVPEVLRKKAEEWEKTRREVELAQSAFKAAVDQLEKGVMVVLDLAFQLGLEFEAHSLVVKSVQPGSQAAEKGISRGWRARSLGGVPLKKGRSLFRRIERLKKHGLSKAVLSLSPPPLVVSFDRRPMGISVERSEELGLFFVREASAAAKAKGLRPGAVLTAIDAQDVSEMQMEEVLELLREVILPVRLVFEQARASGVGAAARAVSKADAEAAAQILVEDSDDEQAPPPPAEPAIPAAAAELRVDLSKPLGITFSDDAVAQDVKAGMQAAELGVRRGWRAQSVAGESVTSTKELAAMISELKAAGIMRAKMVFATSAEKAAPVAQPAAAQPAREPPKAPAAASGAEDSAEAADFNIDLSQPLGIHFDDNLVVSIVQGGSQAARWGIAKGWRAHSLGGRGVPDTAALAAGIKAAKQEGRNGITIGFFRRPGPAAAAAGEPASEAVPPATVPAPAPGPAAAAPAAPPAAAPAAALAERPAEVAAAATLEVRLELKQPLGIGFDDNLRVKAVKPGSQAQALGVLPGMLATSVGGEAISTSSALVGVVKAAQAAGVKTVAISFSVPSGTEPATRVQEAAAGAPAPNGGGKRPAEGPRSIEVQVDLSQPLGIGFDKDNLTAKDVQAASQAARLGVQAGWRVLAAGGEAVQTTRALAEKLKGLKVQGTPSVAVKFLVPEIEGGAPAEKKPRPSA